MKGSKPLDDFVRSRITRDVKNLFLQCLYIFEDAKAKGQITEEEFVLIRKRVLDYGNSTIRSIDKLLESFNVEVKGEKETDKLDRT